MVDNCYGEFVETIEPTSVVCVPFCVFFLSKLITMVIFGEPGVLFPQFPILGNASRDLMKFKKLEYVTFHILDILS